MDNGSITAEVAGHRIIRTNLTPYSIINAGFGFLVVNKPLKRQLNGRKTKTHESDQTIIAVTRARKPKDKALYIVFP